MYWTNCEFLYIILFSSVKYFVKHLQFKIQPNLTYNSSHVISITLFKR